ncbi:MAG: aminopeptidase P family protein [Candidatus Protochlamydia sp.]|nr:aminopeptidase P family protein [Candidatus Protochlamydia sp.]
MDYSSRLYELKQYMDNLPCEALLIEHPLHLLYLTGLELSAGQLIVSKDSACLIVDGRYFERCSSQQLYSVVLQVESVLSSWLEDHNIQSLGFEGAETTYQRYQELRKLSGSTKQNAEMVPIDSPVRQMRLIKDTEEIIFLKQAARLGYEGYEYVVSLFEVGVTEEELAFELEFFWKKRGAKKLAFDPIIAFDANSSMPHYRAGSTPLRLNTSVLIDIGVVLEHYHSDMSRVVYYGQPPYEIQTIYPIVEEAKELAMRLCRPGTLIGELDHAARSHITAKGYGKNFTHSLGHGVGLDIHEYPTLRSAGTFSQTPLQAGMVITIEPGIYLPGIGGVRLEDTLLITEAGYENLTIPNKT